MRNGCAAAVVVVGSSVGAPVSVEASSSPPPSSPPHPASTSTAASAAAVIRPRMVHFPSIVGLRAVSIVGVVRSAPLLALLVLVVAGSATACGEEGGGGPTDAEAAASFCAVLVDWTDDTAAIVNDAQPALQEGVDLRPLLLAAVDEVIARTDELGDELDALDLPDTEGGRVLADDLASGQRAAAADLAGFRAELAAIPDPDPESTNYRKAQLVVELEKPRSLVKPDVQGDLGDADLEAAIAAEPACRFVTRSQ